MGTLAHYMYLPAILLCLIVGWWARGVYEANKRRKLEKIAEQLLEENNALKRQKNSTPNIW
jgi:hypothetical protein